MKRNFDRKPSTPNDHKVAALISHYEAELIKKMDYIELLKKQLKNNAINPRKSQN
jgi:hypothetical protein